MPINHQLTMAASMSSLASIEIRDTVEQNLDFYRERGYSYIPLPFTDEYYDVASDEIESIAPEQYIVEDASIRQTLEQLQGLPFLLIFDDVELFELDGELRFGRKVDRGSDEGTFLGNLSEVVRESQDAKKRIYEIVEGRGVFRIITLADVNRRVVKEALYAVIAELETRLSKAIEDGPYEPDDLYQDLKPETVGRWVKNRSEDVNVGISQYMNLGEMLKIVGKTPPLRERFGYESRSQFDDELGGIVGKRHRVMHASRNLVSDIDELKSLTKYISNAESTIETDGGTIHTYYSDIESPISFTEPS